MHYKFNYVKTICHKLKNYYLYSFTQERFKLWILLLSYSLSLEEIRLIISAVISASLAFIFDAISVKFPVSILTLLAWRSEAIFFELYFSCLVFELEKKPFDSLLYSEVFDKFILINFYFVYIFAFFHILAIFVFLFDRNNWLLLIVELLWEKKLCNKVNLIYDTMHIY